MLVVSVILALIFTTPGSGDIFKNNGNDWRGLEVSAKIYYVTGFIAGSRAVSEGYDSYECTLDSKADEKFLSVYSKKELKGMCLIIKETRRLNIFDITVDTIVKGLDQFYSDYKNRSIKMKDAVYVVKGQIEGRSEMDINHILLYLRSGDIENLIVRNEKGEPISFIHFP